MKYTAGEAELRDNVERFRNRRYKYDRMMFVVHSAERKLEAPVGEPVQVGNGNRVAELVARDGLGAWVISRVA